jgi:hypothetical protein
MSAAIGASATKPVRLDEAGDVGDVKGSSWGECGAAGGVVVVGEDGEKRLASEARSMASATARTSSSDVRERDMEADGGCGGVEAMSESRWWVDGEWGIGNREWGMGSEGHQM